MTLLKLEWCKGTDCENKNPHRTRRRTEDGEPNCKGPHGQTGKACRGASAQTKTVHNTPSRKRKAIDEPNAPCKFTPYECFLPTRKDDHALPQIYKGDLDKAITLLGQTDLNLASKFAVLSTLARVCGCFANMDAPTEMWARLKADEDVRRYVLLKVAIALADADSIDEPAFFDACFFGSQEKEYGNAILPTIINAMAGSSACTPTPSESSS